MSGTSLLSMAVTVIVEDDVPSAVTEVGLALTLEFVALIDEKTTDAVCVMPTESVVS